MVLVGAAALAVAAPAQAHGIARAGLALEDAQGALMQPGAACPAGVPAQALTVINEANVEARPLARVENAIVAQSLQLRAAWGTPCVQFGTAGWPVVLQTGIIPGASYSTGGDHYGTGVPGPVWRGAPYAIIRTGGGLSATWSYAFSHEIMEMLVDPNDDTYWTWPDGIRQLLEVCDPVEGYTYTLDGVTVEDFTLPAAWSGASGPYDEAGELSAPLVHGSTVGF